MNESKQWIKWALLALMGGSIVFAAIWSKSDDPYLMGFGCGLLGAVAGQIARAVYWKMPSHREEYQRRMKEQKVSLADERKIMLRQLSGYRMNQIMFLVNFLLCILFSLLKAPTFVVAAMAFALVFQYLCGVILFSHYSKTM